MFGIIFDIYAEKQIQGYHQEIKRGEDIKAIHRAVLQLAKEPKQQDVDRRILQCGWIKKGGE